MFSLHLNHFGLFDVNIVLLHNEKINKKLATKCRGL